MALKPKGVRMHMIALEHGIVIHSGKHVREEDLLPERPALVNHGLERRVIDRDIRGIRAVAEAGALQAGDFRKKDVGIGRPEKDHLQQIGHVFVGDGPGVCAMSNVVDADHHQEQIGRDVGGRRGQSRTILSR